MKTKKRWKKIDGKEDRKRKNETDNKLKDKESEGKGRWKREIRKEKMGTEKTEKKRKTR